MTSTRSTPTSVSPEPPEPGIGPAWQLRIDMSSGYGVLERIIAVIRIRGVQVTALRYDAAPDGLAHAELDAVGLDPGLLRLLGARIGRITGVRQVSYESVGDRPAEPGRSPMEEGGDGAPARPHPAGQSPREVRATRTGR